jgi:broad specificity phosphatase PhoE
MLCPDYTVDLIRHAESLMNVAMADAEVPFIGGRENHIGLSQLGESQARSLGHFALDTSITPTQLHCSPAVRSQRTCQLSAEVIGLVIPANVDGRLQELDQGVWTNQPRTTYDDPVNKAAMQAAGSDFAPPGGQSMNDVADQMDSFFKSLSDSTDNGEHVWVHTHGVAIKAWLGRLCGWSHERTYKTIIDNVAVTRVVNQSGFWQPVFINKPTAHMAT